MAESSHREMEEGKASGSGAKASKAAQVNVQEVRDSNEGNRGPDGHRPNEEEHPLLAAFQELVGIRTDEAVRHPGGYGTMSRGSGGERRQPHRPETSMLRVFFGLGSDDEDGLYQRALDEEYKARVCFRVSAFTLNCLYILQIIVAATFTGLSPYEGHRTTLTGLGALNTVLAGFLALMKGQGLPNRYLKDRDQFQSVIDAIVSKERFYSKFKKTPDDPLDVELVKSVNALQQMYSIAKRDQQDNYPEVYVSNHERAAVMAREEALVDSLPKSSKDVQKRIEELQKQLESDKALLEQMHSKPTES